MFSYIFDLQLNLSIFYLLFDKTFFFPLNI